MKILEFLSAIDQKQRDYIIGGIVLVLALFICYKGIYQKGANNVAQYNKQCQEQTTKNNLREEISKLGSISKGYEDIVLQSKDADAIRRQLSKLASESKVKVVSISSTREYGADKYVVFSTTMQLECTYDQLGKFVEIIENAKPRIEIKSISFEATGPQPQAQRWESQQASTDINAPAVAGVNIVLETYSSRQ
ncbi:MAG: type 4a pilus biogenesis protein PilO [Candidatus Omnitrophota bacterium]